MNIARDDFIRIVVLNEISDGYQPFGGIDREARSAAARCGLVDTPDEIRGALSGLIGY
jgi:hypothetical protein